ncbi:hypothetical protein BD289DRAFT_73942 [Coniella lustricola]|uniref:Secreted protein n=1 Tax=Coniella lustricola TaxID=2025994 RepID=A0A2T3AHI5_9PEZI|nr:hypothetical protein BD289DRAFT_73942 [Coniella lustricola]
MRALARPYSLLPSLDLNGFFFLLLLVGRACSLNGNSQTVAVESILLVLPSPFSGGWPCRYDDRISTSPLVLPASLIGCFLPQANHEYYMDIIQWGFDPKAFASFLPHRLPVSALSLHHH